MRIRAWWLLLGCALRLPAAELEADGFGLTLDELGRITDLRIASRPAPVNGSGGWELLDIAGGTDERFFFGLGSSWFEGNPWGLEGPQWRVGLGWERPDETFNGDAIVRVTDPPDGRSDPLRFRVNTAGDAVYTVAVYVRCRGFAGRPTMAVLPINAVGQATGRLVPLDWRGADRREGEWFRVSGVIAPVPTTAFLELYIGLEEARGTFEVGGAEIVFHTAGQRHDLNQRLVPSAGGYRVAGEASGVRLTSTYHALGPYIVVESTFAATDGDDHCFTARFSLPLNGTGWDWWDSLRRRQTIPETGGRLLGNWRHLSGGRSVSPYPLGCVSRAAPAQALALAAPLSQPVLTRFGFRQERGLFAEFDLALSPRLDHLEATVRLAILAPEAAWGMRGAVEHYYGLYESDVLRLCPQAGAWFCALNPEAVPDPERLGLLFDEQAAAHLGWSRGHGLVPMATSLPWGRFESGSADTYPAADGLYPIEPVSRTKPPPGAAFVDADGREVAWSLADGTRYAPWCTTPGLGSESPAAVVNALLASRLQGDDGEPLGGLVLDGVAADWSGWQIEDYDDEHLRASAAPLTFSRATRRPLAYSAVSHLEYLGALAARLRARGQVVLGSLAADAAVPMVAPYLDVLGAGEQLPSSEHLMWLRVIGYRKPLSFLDPTVLDPTVLRSEQNAVWQRALLWGAFPGAAGWLTARNVGLHRAFFEVYVPVLRELAAAGWEPVPHAFVNDAAIELERYGYRDDLYLVLHNGTDLGRNLVLTVDPTALGLVTIGAGGLVERRLVFVDRLSRSKRPIELRVANDRWQTTITMPPRSVAVLTPYKVDVGLDMLANFDLLPAP